jgi:hypothetical protein
VVELAVASGEQAVGLVVVQQDQAEVFQAEEFE